MVKLKNEIKFIFVHYITTPVNPIASINMLITSTPGGPATHTHSKAHTTTDTRPPTDVKTTSNKVHTPPPLTQGCKDTLSPIQNTNPFSKHISKQLLNGKVPSHEVNTFTHIKGLLYKKCYGLKSEILGTSHP